MPFNTSTLGGRKRENDWWMIRLFLDQSFPINAMHYNAREYMHSWQGREMQRSLTHQKRKETFIFRNLKCKCLNSNNTFLWHKVLLTLFLDSMNCLYFYLLLLKWSSFDRHNEFFALFSLLGNLFCFWSDGHSNNNSSNNNKQWCQSLNMWLLLNTNNDFSWEHRCRVIYQKHRAIH